jgi:predicted nucleic acid-binding protein
VTVVVSDTSPINYLVLIGAIDVLPRLFAEVLIPPAVIAELQHPRTPANVSKWAEALPQWAKVITPTRIQQDIALGAGETEAISLALELTVPAILIDDWQGRLAAEQRGIIPVGTLNILETADRRGFLDFESAITRLRGTNFHVAPALIESLLAQVRARKSGA